MNPLIAVVTCHKNRSQAQAQRDTWARNAPVKFFYGVGTPQHQDDVILDVLDNYLSLPHKVQAAVKWAVKHGYTHVFKIDDDAYVDVERLLKSGFEQHPYIGKQVVQHSTSYCHGGAGYWLDTRAMQAVIKAKVAGLSEDGWVAGALFPQGIVPYNDPRYVYSRRICGDPFPETPSPKNDVITSAEFVPEELRRVHRGRTQEVDPTDAMSADEYLKFLRGA